MAHHVGELPDRHLGPAGPDVEVRDMKGVMCKLGFHIWMTIWKSEDSRTYDAVQCLKCEEIRWRTK